MTSFLRIAYVAWAFDVNKLCFRGKNVISLQWLCMLTYLKSVQLFWTILYTFLGLCYAHYKTNCSYRVGLCSVV